jgi:hypothetical protein
LINLAFYYSLSLINQLETAFTSHPEDIRSIQNVFHNQKDLILCSGDGSAIDFFNIEDVLTKKTQSNDLIHGIRL